MDDPREWKTDQPLGFRNLAEDWLSVKKETVRPSSYRNLKIYINRAIAVWDNRNVKHIKYLDIQKLILEQEHYSDKTKANMRSALHDLWMWLLDCEILQLHQIPKFPKVKFELGYRQVIGKETQSQIINEVRRLTENLNPRIYLAIKFLSTYISIRPGELRMVQEKDFDLEGGYIFIRHSKTRAKAVPLLKEDVELVRAQVKGLPELFFFRHLVDYNRIQAGEQFGPKFLNEWWKRACKNLGVEGVPLYPGTRHSSVRALRKYMGRDAIKEGTMHATNAAFERYYDVGADDIREVYAKAALSGQGQVIPVEFKRKKNEA